MFKKQCRQKEKLFQKNKEENLISQAETDRTRFWQILKSKENYQVSNPQVDASDWIVHFSTLFESEDTNINPLGREEHSYALPVTTMFSDCVNAEFTELEIHEEILETPSKKSSGSDGLTYEALKSTAHYIAPLLKKLFNDTLSNG